MKETRICVIGLGYVGLPLARLFSTKYRTIGFDMNAKRCEALMAGHDATLEVSDELLQDAIINHGLVCTDDIEKIRDCNFYIENIGTRLFRVNGVQVLPGNMAKIPPFAILDFSDTMFLFIPNLKFVENVKKAMNAKYYNPKKRIK